VIRETGLVDSAFPVGLIGSVFRAGALFVEPLSEAICAVAPGAAVAAVEMPPVGGSLLLAARACGCSAQVDPAELAELLDSAAQAVAAHER
jgi:hypothetical protein